MQLTQRQIVFLLVAVAVIAYFAAQAGAGSRVAAAPTPIVYLMPNSAPYVMPTPFNSYDVWQQQERNQFVDQQRQRCAMSFPAPSGCP